MLTFSISSRALFFLNSKDSCFTWKLSTLTCMRAMTSSKSLLLLPEPGVGARARTAGGSTGVCVWLWVMRVMDELKGEESKV